MVLVSVKGLLEIREELFGKFCRGAYLQQLADDLALERDVTLPLGDMTQHHLQVGFHFDHEQP